MSAQECADSTRQSAEAYLREGFVPLPIQPNGKIPIERAWAKKAVPTLADLDRWFSTGRYNLGIRTGAISGLIVLDIDPRHGGDDVLAALIVKYGPLPDTPVVLTPSGGCHYWFALTEGLSIGNSVSKIGMGLDVRGNGGQVVCPPSAINGKSYEFDGGEWPRRANLAPIPPWLIALCTDARRAEKTMKAEPELGIRQAVYAAGGRNDALFRLAAAMRNKGMAEKAIREALRLENAAHCLPPLEEEEVERIAGSAQRYEPSPAWQEIWRDGLHQGKKRLKGTASNLALILGNDPRLAGRLALNELTEGPVSTDRLPWMAQPGPLLDDDLIALRCWIANPLWSGYEIDEPSQSAAHDAVRQTAGFQRVNPIRMFIEATPWDGVARIDRLLADVWELDQTNYLAAISRILIIGAVQRAYRPGCKMDYMPILEGVQGCGKSWFIERLYAPWSSCKTTADFIGRDPIVELQGIWAQEIAELSAFTRAEIQAVKDFITRTTDTYTPKYALDPVTRPRRSILIGTTNDDQYLRDHTGNRRFLPTPVGPNFANLDYVDANRSQLFAEGRVRIDESLVIADTVMEAALGYQEAAYVRDPWEEILAEWAHLHPTGRFSMAEVLREALRIEPGRQTKADQMRVSAVLRNLGFERVTRQRTAEGQFWIWARLSAPI